MPLEQFAEGLRAVTGQWFNLRRARSLAPLVKTRCFGMTPSQNRGRMSRYQKVSGRLEGNLSCRNHLDRMNSRGEAVEDEVVMRDDLRGC